MIPDYYEYMVKKNEELYREKHILECQVAYMSALLASFNKIFSIEECEDANHSQYWKNKSFNIAKGIVENNA